MTCAKIFSMEVGASGDCDIFQGIVWDAPGTTAAAFGSFNQNSFSLDAETPTSADYSNYSQITCEGGFVYTGPELVCNFRLNLTQFISEPPPPFSFSPATFFSLLVFWGPSFDLILDVYKEWPEAGGIFDFPITIPISSGDDLFIQVSAAGGVGTSGSPGATLSGHITASGAFGEPP